MPRVLIVDDEASIREALVLIVEAEGLEAVEAGDGAEALEIVKEQPTDLILLDVSMPQVNGLEFLRFMRADPAMTRPPVIMVTAAGSPDDKYAAQRLGVVDYISKPWAPGEIELRIGWALKSGSTAPAVPWELSEAAENLRGVGPKLLDGDSKRDENSRKGRNWSALTLPKDSETDVITPEEGGWLVTKDGRVRVTVPAGAVRRALALSASPTDVDGELDPASVRVRLGGEAVDLTFSDRTGTPMKGTRLDLPMEISLQLDEATRAIASDTSSIQGQEVDSRHREWSDLPTDVDKGTGAATVNKTDFHQGANWRKSGVILAISSAGSEQDELYEVLDSAGFELIETDPDYVIPAIIDERPDIVLLDIEKNPRNGINILKRIKGDPRTRRVTVITLGPAEEANHDDARSGYAQSMALGARDMIEKPWHPGDLQARIGRAVDSTRARTAQSMRAAKRAGPRTNARLRKTA